MAYKTIKQTMSKTNWKH